MSNVLEVRHLSKRFAGSRKTPGKEVLADVSFRVDEGEFVTLIGPSGSGKTTLFRLIGGLELPMDGDIAIHGSSTVGTRGHIAYMPQQASLMPWLTVSANIELSLTIAGIGKGEARAQARDWLAESAWRRRRTSIRTCSRAACSSGYPSCGRCCPRRS